MVASNSPRPKSTLILGAGASCPYRFPTASELREILVQKSQGRVKEALQRMRAPERLWDIIRGHLLPRFEEERLQQFQNEFFWSQTGSIDEFVQQRPAFGNLAKAALAAIFLNCEASSYLDGNWYRVLRRFVLAHGPEHLPSERVLIITFNYERSLEYYLWKAIQYTYGLPAETALSASRALPIYHVYGSLGSLGGSSGATHMVPWGSRDDQSVKNAAESLHLIQPRSAGLPDNVAAFLKESDFVAFLGFGFWPENFRMIQQYVTDQAGVYGSNRGLAPVLKNRITERFPKMTWGDGWTVEDCMQGWNLFPGL